MLRSRSVQINPLVGILFFVGFIIMMYYLLKGFFYVAYYAAPLVILAVVLLDYTLIVNHFKGLWQRVKQEPASGILWLIINILAFPIVAFWLLLVALFTRKVRKVQKQQERLRRDEYVDYEIVDDETPLRINEHQKDNNKDSYWRS